VTQCTPEGAGRLHGVWETEVHQSALEGHNIEGDVVVERTRGTHRPLVSRGAQGRPGIEEGSQGVGGHCVSDRAPKRRRAEPRMAFAINAVELHEAIRLHPSHRDRDALHSR